MGEIESPCRRLP